MTLLADLSLLSMRLGLDPGDLLGGGSGHDADRFAVVVDGDVGVVHGHVQDLAGVHPADLDLLADDLEVAAAADHPLDGDGPGRGGGWWPGGAGVAQCEALGEWEGAGDGAQQLAVFVHDAGGDAVQADGDASAGQVGADAQGSAGQADGADGADLPVDFDGAGLDRRFGHGVVGCRAGLPGGEQRGQVFDGQPGGHAFEPATAGGEHVQPLRAEPHGDRQARPIRSEPQLLAADRQVSRGGHDPVDLDGLARQRIDRGPQDGCRPFRLFTGVARGDRDSRGRRRGFRSGSGHRGQSGGQLQRQFPLCPELSRVALDEEPVGGEGHVQRLMRAGGVVMLHERLCLGLGGFDRGERERRIQPFAAHALMEPFDLPGRGRGRGSGGRCDAA